MTDSACPRVPEGFARLMGMCYNAGGVHWHRGSVCDDIVRRGGDLVSRRESKRQNLLAKMGGVA